MAASTEEMINLIGPVLRMQLGTDERYPVVRFVEATDRSAVALSISGSMDETDIIEAASKALGSASGVEAVGVDGVGAFEIDPADETSTGRVAGRVLIVTGAAQGFGLGIAQDLANEGACVALADINVNEAENQAEALRKEYGPNRAMAVAMNVTDLASIHSAIGETVKNFGGFDAFISNAGVVKAESVKTQPAKDFDFITAVNYRGYFLCTQAASQILALQA